MAEPEWKSWFVNLGDTMRRARQLAGLTQAELANRAGASQGGISRLENGRGTCVPLICVLRVLGTLRSALESMPDGLLDDHVRRLLDLSRPRGTSAAMDVGLSALLDTYRAMAPAERVAFVRVALVTANALTDRASTSKK